MIGARPDATFIGSLDIHFTSPNAISVEAGRGARTSPTRSTASHLPSTLAGALWLLPATTSWPVRCNGDYGKQRRHLSCSPSANRESGPARGRDDTHIGMEAKSCPRSTDSG